MANYINFIEIALIQSSPTYIIAQVEVTCDRSIARGCQIPCRCLEKRGQEYLLVKLTWESLLLRVLE